MAKKKTKKKIPPKTITMGKKILILSASPVRDKYIDEMIANHLRRKGHQVWVKQCLREGRKSVLEIQPDIAITPPIRNVYSRDFVENLKKWGIAVVSRHTEASCDWQDFKTLDEKQKADILGRWPYFVDLELVWGDDEAQILSQTGRKFPVLAVGSFSTDVYRNKDIKSMMRSREEHNQKYKFDPNKKNLLIASAWGFADSAPDLFIDDTEKAKKDNEGRDKYLDMINRIYANLKFEWNILITTHADVISEPYKELKLPLDTDSTMIEMLINSDALIHSGSTAAIGSHFLGIPAFQYGDVSAKKSDSWWGRADTALSKVSPYFKEPRELVSAISKSQRQSNANKDALKNLALGRYGKMDGKATERAAALISKLEGKFRYCWPDSTRDYSQLTILKDVQKILDGGHCRVCGKPFFVVKEDWLNMLSNATKIKRENLIPKFDMCCPNCGTRLVMKEIR